MALIPRDWIGEIWSARGPDVREHTPHKRTLSTTDVTQEK